MLLPVMNRSRLKLSVIVIGYKMARQLANTLYTLSARYQRNISAEDYEVVVVENESSDNLDPAALAELGGNFRYFRRVEHSHTPVPAINFAFQQCQGSLVGLMIDGARMVTPRVLEYAVMIARLSDRALTVVPGYHLGANEQHLADSYSETVEQALLDSIAWKSDGHLLFDIASFSGGNNKGFFQPFMECNCLFASANSFRDIGYADPRFTLRGGGSINLHMYRSLGMLPGAQVFITPGEGSFHQFHGGVTTMAYEGRQAELLAHKTQLQSLWPGGFHSLRKEPLLFGAVPHSAQKFLAASVEYEDARNSRLTTLGKPLWEDDQPAHNPRNEV